MLDSVPLSLAIVVALMGMSAFFSSSEAAFLSVQRTRIAHLISEGVPGAQTVASMIANPERLLSTILLGNNLVNVAFTSVVTAAMIAIVGTERQGLGVLLATVVGTIALLIAGEIIPKTIAVRKSERVALLYRYPLLAVERALWPFVMILQWITRGVNALIAAPDDEQASITENEFRALIDIGEAEGEFEPAEAEMLEKVFQFGDSQVVEVMTPRTEIISMRRGASLGDFLEIYANHAHTRFPVYRDSTDDIVGILSCKDVLRHIEKSGLALKDSITDVIRDAYFVPETKRVSELFGEMRAVGSQMALVIDEFGGVSGLVTLKSLLEVLVGPFGEEGESPEDEYRAIDENTFIVEGGMSIAEVNQQTIIDLPDGDYETIAGFALYVLGYIPSQGDRFEYGGMTMEITRMAGLKIEEIRVTVSERAVD